MPNIMTPTNIATLIYQVGGFGPGPYNEADESKVKTQVEAWLDTAIAVCLAESGGDIDAKNSSSSASGMWQIMASVHKDKIAAAIASRGKIIGDPEGYVPTVFDPWVNTEVAKQIYKAAGGWSPWEVYPDALAPHRGHGKRAYAFLANPDNKEMISRRAWSSINFKGNKVYQADVGDYLNAAGDAISNLNPVDRALTFAKDAGITIGAFLLALLLLVLGVWFLLSRTKAFETVTDIAAVVPQGKALKAVT